MLSPEAMIPARKLLPSLSTDISESAPSCADDASSSAHGLQTKI